MTIALLMEVGSAAIAPESCFNHRQKEVTSVLIALQTTTVAIMAIVGEMEAGMGGGD
jgi:hypothetical protein